MFAAISSRIASPCATRAKHRHWRCCIFPSSQTVAGYLCNCGKIGEKDEVAKAEKRMPRSVWNMIGLCIRSNLYQASPSTYGRSHEHPGSDLLDIVCQLRIATNCSRANSYCKIFSMSTGFRSDVVAAMQLNDATASAAASSRSMVRGRSFFLARYSNGQRCLRWRRRAARHESAWPNERTGYS